MLCFRRISFYATLALLCCALLRGSNGQEVSLEPAPEPSLEHSLEPSMEPSSESDATLMSITTLIQESYMRHIDFIRQGLPMPLVRSFFNYALKEVSKVPCMSTLDSLVSGSCVSALFAEDDEFATNTLLNIMSDDDSRPYHEKLFPHVVRRVDLPDLQELEIRSIEEARAQTLAAIGTAAGTDWEIAVFPLDEELRFDPGKDIACREVSEKMDSHSLTMSASALTAYVLGVAEQIVLSNGEDPSAKVMLDEHARLMYNGARCSRRSGENLEVPTVYLDGFITKAHLALINTSISSSSTVFASFPSLTAVKEIIRGSRHFFSEEIERLASLNSFGTINYITWTGTEVSSETLNSRMQSKVNLQQFSDFYGIPPEADTSEPCSPGFRKNARLKTITEDGQMCCSESCIRTSGRIIDVYIINEMCCDACNQAICDVNKLARVIEVQAFRFSRS